MTSLPATVDETEAKAHRGWEVQRTQMEETQKKCEDKPKYMYRHRKLMSQN